MVSLPVERFVEILASTEYGEEAVNLDEYTTIIAHDLLQQYFAELLQEVSNTTMASQLNGDLVKDIKKRVATAKFEINRLNPEINQKIQQKYTLIQNVKNIEKQLGTQLQEVLG
jgi:conjugative transfer pilus assembly protein TraH